MPTRRILLIDDDQDILRGTRLRLRAAGYDTLEARNGVDGVMQAVRHRPDAILMDVRMPRADGLAALQTLQSRADTKDIGIVMLSASLRDQKAALTAGARSFLRKPFQAQSLLAALREAIGDTPEQSGTEAVTSPPEVVHG